MPLQIPGVMVFRKKKFELSGYNRTLEAIELLNVISAHDLVMQMEPVIIRVKHAAQVGETDNVLNFWYDEANQTYLAQLSQIRKVPADKRTLAVIACAADFLLTHGKTASEAAEVPSLDAPSGTESETQPTDIPKTPSTTNASGPPNSVALVPSEPFYNGRTLPQWLEILERDRDTEARLTAMKAIRELTSKAESQQVTERLVALARQSNAEEWSDLATMVEVVKFGGRKSSSATLDSSLINLLISLNSPEWFHDFLVKDLLVGDDVWTARWLAALLKNQKPSRVADNAIIYNHYQDKRAFDALGPNSAWLAEAWLLLHLISDEAIASENLAQVIELIEQQPHLGKMVVLQIDADIETRFGANNNSSTPATSRSQLIVEEAIAELARTVLQDEDSSPEAVARAASRLASTTEIVKGWKPELMEVLRNRFSALDADHNRLVTMLPIEPKLSRPSSQMFAINGTSIPVVNRFSADSGDGRQARQVGVQQFGGSNRSQFRQPGFVPPYIESECLALIALMIRLDAAAECEQELVAIAEKTWPEFDSLITQSGVQDLRQPAMIWPYRIKAAGEPWTSISAETWLGWAIHRTLFEYSAQRTAPLPQLADVRRRTELKLSFMQADRDRDGKISIQAFPESEAASAVDANKDGSVDFDEYMASFLRDVPPISSS